MTTITSHTTWFQKIGQSIKNIGLGLLLLVAASALLFWNEGRAVQRAEVLSEGRGAVVQADANNPSSDHEGKLIHLTGQAASTEILQDPAINLSLPSLKLSRTVQMYQWAETSRKEEKKNVGGSTDTITTFSYQTEWEEGLIDSSKFQESEAHTNPSSLALSSQEFLAEPITIGTFTLDPSILNQLQANQPLLIKPTMLGTYTPASSSAQVLRQPPVFTEEYVYFSADYTTPKVGDIRIKYTHIPSQVLSVVAKQENSVLKPFPISGDSISLIAAGTKTADELFMTAEEANVTTTWILRALGVALAVAAIKLILSLITAVADLIPFVSSILGFGTRVIAFILGLSWSLVIIAIAWLWYRPLVSLVILAVVVGIWVLASKYKTNKA